MLKFSARRWGDADTYFGPFTFARDRTYKHLGIALKSTDDEGRGCSLRISGFGATFIVALPDWVLRPERKKVYPDWDAATIARLGRDWYWDITPRQFGVSLFEGHLDISYGRVTHDSSTEQRWGCFLPWTQWRHMRHSLYTPGGALYAHVPQRRGRFDSAHWEAERALINSCPTATFAFTDYDGEALTATTRIEEREWHFGTGWFKWLSLFVPAKVSRSLDIDFSGETGRRKGSWKGGTTGHSIEMLPGELHEAAFRRYCAAHEMKFVSA